MKFTAMVMKVAAENVQQSHGEAAAKPYPLIRYPIFSPALGPGVLLYAPVTQIR